MLRAVQIVSQVRLLFCAREDENVISVYRQAGRCHIRYCDAYSRRHGIAERKLSHFNAWLPSLAQLFWKVTERRWHGVDFCTIVQVLRVLGDDKAILPAQKVEQSKISNNSTAILRRKAMCTNAILRQLDYSEAFGEDCGRRSIKVSM